MAVFVENLIMGQKKRIQASCSLTLKAAEILARYRNAFGNKHTLSVGLELFDKLDPAEQVARTNQAGAQDKIARAIIKRGGSLAEAIRQGDAAQTPKSVVAAAQAHQPGQPRTKSGAGKRASGDGRSA